MKTRSKLSGILAANTGKDFEMIMRGTECDNYMATAEAREYDLIGEVITHH